MTLLNLIIGIVIGTAIGYFFALGESEFRERREREK